MAIDFHSRTNRSSYTGRQAARDWSDAMRRIVAPEGKSVADVGCGGGIYSRAWRAMGAKAVIGVDFSAEMVGAARQQAGGDPQLAFRQGDAAATGLPSASVDIVFERALIHHLRDYQRCFAEAHRVLVRDGTLIVQDRTPGDIDLPGSAEHVRGYFFECFPRLRTVELARRPTDGAVRTALEAAGFQGIATTTLWEVRKIHGDREHLKQDLLARTGRSILHDLDDRELGALVAHIASRLPDGGPVTEKDRWTVWSAVA
jgi:ubiquinone/menaquinone biosynthesis C-methylase UbiE